VLSVIEKADSPLQLREITRLTGLSAGQVKNVLRKSGTLRKLALVERVSGGWTESQPDIDAIERQVQADVQKRRKVADRMADERAKRAAQVLINWRIRYDHVAYAIIPSTRMCRVSDSAGSSITPV